MNRSETELANAALSPDGIHLITASFAGELALWQTATGALVRRWRRESVRSETRWSPDGASLAFRSTRPGFDGGYTVTAIDASTGAERILADLDPDDGGELGFDWTVDGRGVVFADTDAASGAVALYLAPLPSEGCTALRRTRERRGITVPTGVRPERVMATAGGYFCAYEGEAAMIGDDGAVRWSHATPTDQHAMSPARNALVSFHERQAILRAIDGDTTAIDCPHYLGNQVAWSRDGARVAIDASLGLTAGHAVFTGATMVATIADAPTRDGMLAMHLEGWSCVALDRRGERLVVADNDRGELRAWDVAAPTQPRWKAELDDVSVVQWNGPVVVVASSTQVMFVDGATGRVIGRGAISG